MNNAVFPCQPAGPGRENDGSVQNAGKFVSLAPNFNAAPPPPAANSAPMNLLRLIMFCSAFQMPQHLAIVPPSTEARGLCLSRFFRADGYFFAGSSELAFCEGASAAASAGVSSGSGPAPR